VLDEAISITAGDYSSAACALLSGDEKVVRLGFRVRKPKGGDKLGHDI